jgi:predicted TIM-barrel fold metal-dependent hydrolase
MTFVRSDAVERIRSRIDHPIVDADGHYVQFMPRVREILRDLAGERVAARLDARGMRGGHLQTRGFWGLPAQATLDRMTAVLPRLLYERLDELGIDFAVLYPTPGPLMTEPDDELRQAAFRAFNRYAAEAYDGYRDRLSPAALIPTFTPEEAVAELDYAVGELGLRVVRLEGTIPRQVRPDGTQASWVDTLGHESLYDYDPVWRRCLELGVVPAFHGNGMGWGSRVSTKNYVHNHVGSFAAAQEAVCRSLVMGGAPMRFPRLPFAFLEGGVAWACDLFAGLLSHYEKRNRDAVRQYDPARFDRALGSQLFSHYADGRLAPLLQAFDRSMGLEMSAAPDPRGVDDFAESGIRSAEDLAGIFRRQFNFGCEADDRLNPLAFDARLLPGGARLNALFSSDIGHWDVTDMRGVLPEAWELVEQELLTAEQFREFTCGNVVRMLTAVDPDFFRGTVLEGTAAESIQST